MNELNADKLRELLARSPKRGAQILSELGKKSQFIKALNSEVGKEILSELIGMAESKLSKIIALEASEQEICEYRVMKEILDRWSAKIEVYQKNIDYINQGGQ